MKDIEAIRRGVAHMVLNGWELVYGGWGTVGFWSYERQGGVGVVYRETAKDPEGERIGEVTTLGQKFQAPVDLWVVPEDIFEKLARFTKVPPLKVPV